MALLAKKFWVSKAGVNYAHNIYSSTGDIPNGIWMGVTVDGVTGYVAAGAANLRRSTPGRIRKSNGNTYALWTSAPPAYGYGVYWSNTTFTVPQGVYVIRATAIGGGAGGCSETRLGNPVYFCGTAFTGNRINGAVAGGWSVIQRNGGNIFTASGATAPVLNVTPWYGCCSYDRDGGCRRYAYNDAVASSAPSYGTNSTAWYWDDASHGGSGAVAFYRYDGAYVSAAGAGGYADADWGFRGSCPGANGYKSVGNVAVNPGEVLSIYIGGGGHWQSGSSLQWNSWNSDGHGGDHGYNGVVMIEWGGGIDG